MQQTLLNVHNKFRNQQALGQTPNYSPAAKMATMQWDPTLAALCELLDRNCTFAHDACRNTRNLYYSCRKLREVD